MKSLPPAMASLPPAKRLRIACSTDSSWPPKLELVTRPDEPDMELSSPWTPRHTVLSPWEHGCATAGGAASSSSTMLIGQIQQQLTRPEGADAFGEACAELQLRLPQLDVSEADYLAKVLLKALQKPEECHLFQRHRTHLMSLLACFCDNKACMDVVGFDNVRSLLREHLRALRQYRHLSKHGESAASLQALGASCGRLLGSIEKPIAYNMVLDLSLNEVSIAGGALLLRCLRKLNKLWVSSEEVTSNAEAVLTIVHDFTSKVLSKHPHVAGCGVGNWTDKNIGHVVKGVRELASFVHCVAPRVFTTWVEQHMDLGAMSSRERRFLQDVLGIVPNCECFDHAAPDHVVHRIVQYLEPSDVRCYFAPVSRQFCSIGLCHSNSFRDDFNVWQKNAGTKLREAAAVLEQPSAVDDLSNAEAGLNVSLLVTSFSHVKTARSFLSCCTPLLPVLTARCNSCKRFLCLIVGLAKIARNEGEVVNVQSLTQGVHNILTRAQMQFVRSLINELLQRVTLLLDGIHSFSKILPGDALPVGWSSWYEEFSASSGLELEIFELARDVRESFSRTRSILQSLMNVSVEMLQLARSIALWASRQ